MSTHHHLDHATILRYAAGDLDDAFSVIVASHIAMCDTCRAQVRAAEELGGAGLDSCAQAPMATNAFDALLNRLDDAAPIEMPKRQRQKSDVVAPLARLIGPSLDDLKWKTVGPGVRQHKILTTAEGSSLYLLNIGAGRAVPEHGHGGMEMTLVLSGAYRDVLGRFGAGDIADLDEHVEHQPMVEEGADCICLVATEAPTRFKGWISRMLQPLIGI